MSKPAINNACIIDVKRYLFPLEFSNKKHWQPSVSQIHLNWHQNHIAFVYTLTYTHVVLFMHTHAHVGFLHIHAIILPLYTYTQTLVAFVHTSNCCTHNTHTIWNQQTVCVCVRVYTHTFIFYLLLLSANRPCPCWGTILKDLVKI